MVIILAPLLNLGIAHPAKAESRVALVVGEGAYTHAGRLDNPPRDAELVRKALEQDGFATIVLTDAARAQFQAGLRSFRNRAEGADVAVVYYAGHGIEGGGKNWLVPVDARLNSEYDLADEAIELDRVLEALGGAKLRVVVLDACRNNPFGAAWKSGTRSVTRGLARVQVDDVLVIYAAAPGQTATDGNGANSPFSTSLARRLTQPGLALQLLGGVVRDDVLAATGGAQRPFISASITGNPIYLVNGVQPAQDSAQGHTAQSDRYALEALLWKSVIDRNSDDSYQNYLTQFPDGVFAAEARARLAALRRGPPPGTASSINGSAEQRLQAIGKVTKPVSGDPGDDEYSYGYRLWEAKFFPEAEKQLLLFVNTYPAHRRISAARNLLGRLYLDDGRPGAAAQWFVSNYQADVHGDRAGDSLLFLAEAMIQLKETKRACIALLEFKNNFSTSLVDWKSEKYKSLLKMAKCDL